MQRTRTQESQEDVADMVEVESFMRADTELRSERCTTGMLRLVDCNVVKSRSNLPQAYRENYSKFNYDEYLVFDAVEKKGGDTLKVVVPGDKAHSQHRMLLDWCGAHSISEIAGESVPVYHVNENVYRVNSFTSTLVTKFSSVDRIQSLVDRGTIEYDGSGWQFSTNIMRMISLIFFTGLIVVSTLSITNSDAFVGPLIVSTFAVLMLSSNIASHLSKR